MTLYYSLVFLMLVSEMALFVLLIAPLPFTVRRKLFTFISESPFVAKIQYGMKICFIAVLVLFVDSVNRVYRVQMESYSGSDQAGSAMAGPARQELLSRRFYSQRNVYLCGSTLFLSLVLNRVYTLILDLLKMEEKIKQVEGNPAAKGKDSAKLANAGGLGEIGGLKRELERKEKELQAMKQQSQALSREYHNLSDQVSAQGGVDSTPRKDV
ncbi:MAG: hypothetical protein M1823_002865 [Watsoniomyces obsoletus]|nr:MAG: hypothetical protein M1823_002865 [Watsoniomyces obsoletus]